MQPPSDEEDLTALSDLLLHDCGPSATQERGLALLDANTRQLVKYNAAFAGLLGIPAFGQAISVSDLQSSGCLPPELDLNPLTWSVTDRAQGLHNLRLTRIPDAEHRELWLLHSVSPSPAASIAFVDETHIAQEEEKPPEQKRTPRARKAWQEKVITMRRFIRHAPQSTLLELEPAPSPYVYPRHPS